MPYLIGVAVALAVWAISSGARFDRDRSFYATVLLVVGSYYVLFAALSGSARVAAVEVLIMSPFVAAAVVGFRSNLWLVVLGLAGHGVMDSLHSSLVANHGVPPWWPAFCMAFDLAAAAILARLILRAKAGEPPLLAAARR